MKNQLIEDNMNLVYYLIHKYYPTYANDEDIVQAGMLGLCKAADSFDESKSMFSTYASRCILNAIKHEFRNRKKHQGVLSLDYPVSDDEGKEVSFGDLCVGDEDVEFVDLAGFNDKLTPMEQEIVKLRKQGLTIHEIGKRIGREQSTVSRKLRKIIALWRSIND